MKLDLGLNISKKTFGIISLLVMILTSYLFKEELYIHYFSDEIYPSMITSKTLHERKRRLQKGEVLKIILYRILGKTDERIYMLSTLNENNENVYLTILKKQDFTKFSVNEEVSIVRGLKGDYKILNVYSEQTCNLLSHHFICLIIFIFYFLIAFKKP